MNLLETLYSWIKPSDCGTNGGGTAAGLKQVGNGLGEVVTGAVDVVGGVVHTATGLVGDVIHVKGGGGGGGGGDNCEEPEPTPENCD